MADYVYPAYKNRLAGGAAAIDLDSDTLKVLLVTSSYTPAMAHDFRDDVTNEVTGTGYTAGGVALSGKSIAASGDNYVFDASDASWASSTITARGAVLYKDVGTAATDPLIAYFDFGSNITSTNGTSTIQWNASGILLFS